MTEEDLFYPGSKRVRRSQGGDAPVLETLPSEDWEALGRERQTMDGHYVTFYPISALAMALGRGSITMREWESKGVLPIPPRSVSFSTKGRRRMYTKDQILGLQQIARDEGLLNGKRVYVTQTAFGVRAARLFEELAK